MTTQTYCIIDNLTNKVDNIVALDDSNSTWTPPSNYSYVPQATTPSKVWSWNKQLKDWVMLDTIGHGGIGFTWNGTTLITSDPKPPMPPLPPEPVNPTVEGAQTL